MAQYPPPPPTAGGPVRGQRPGTVTTVGVLLIIAGGFAVLAGLLSFGLSGLSGIFTLFGIIYLPVGALEIYAGIQVLNLKEIGRTLGMIMAAIGAVIGLIFITKGTATSVIGILLDAFIIYTLYSNKQYFTA
jgi:uncharacterized membrane protein HdeD (DUF308 family)